MKVGHQLNQNPVLPPQQKKIGCPPERERKREIVREKERERESEIDVKRDRRDEMTEGEIRMEGWRLKETDWELQIEIEGSQERKKRKRR